MKSNIYLLAMILFLFSCQNPIQENSTQKKQTVKQEISKLNSKQTAKGYELMKQKCFICHFEKPAPSKRDKMIAPPMLRVQEHYKPAYPTKEAFVKAIVSYVDSPSEDKTLMPGAARKFGLMPKLNYDKNEVKLIAETLYDMNFDKMPKMMMMNEKPKLNNGKKWKLKKESIDKIHQLQKKVTAFRSDNIDDYHKLGKELLESAKFLLMDKSYTGELGDQIHVYFHSLEEPIHQLMKVKDLKKADVLVSVIKKKLLGFDKFFE